MAFEPEDERAARRDMRTVEIARVLVLLGITALGLALVFSLGGIGGPDVVVALVAFAAAGTLVLAVRRIIRMRRSGL
jgi:hypothetical protein